ncbi:hypothetical protein V6N13_028092 [Hibiscus sabdariffa]|uniref:Uncharacterized protein n=1 Tax=Hibiscus sabdariffa TaxID=183260 RepID=A0ABR2B115_9ROSI
MGSEAEKEWSYTPKLPLFSSPAAHMQSPERSGALSPPLHASASVPFRWEEEPGKPKPCAILTVFSNPNDLSQNRSPERVHLGSVVPSKRGTYKAKGFLGSWRRRMFKARREVGVIGNSYVFPSTGDRDSECSTEEESNSTTTGVNITRIKRVGSFRSLLHSKSNFWTTIYEGFKLSVPWSKKGKMDGFNDL